MKTDNSTVECPWCKQELHVVTKYVRLMGSGSLRKEYSLSNQQDKHVLEHIYMFGKVEPEIHITRCDMDR